MVTETRVYRPKPAAEIHRNMSAIRSENNQVETELRKRVHRLGVRFRKYPRGLVGRPDFVFPFGRVAVFVDGDFWHGRTLIEEGLPAFHLRVRNRPYWIEKLTHRVDRDRIVTETLERDGWAVLRFWESDVKRNADAIARSIVELVRSRRERSSR